MPTKKANSSSGWTNKHKEEEERYQESLKKLLGVEAPNASSKRGPLYEGAGEEKTREIPTRPLECPGPGAEHKEEPQKKNERLINIRWPGEKQQANKEQQADKKKRDGGGLLGCIPIGIKLGFAIGVFVLALIYGYRTLTGSGATSSPPAPAATPQAQQPARGAPSGSGSLTPRPTGIVFEKPFVKDGVYYLRSGDLAWKGKLKKSKEGEQLTLEGTTAGQFNLTSLPKGGSISDGAFGRAQPGQPLLFATYQDTSAKAGEVATGNYQIIAGDSSKVLLKGFYDDERQGKGNKVVRFYTESRPGSQEQHTYAVLFEAPPHTPIPALVGWKEPAWVSKGGGR